MLRAARPVVPTFWRRCTQMRYGATPDLEGYRTLKAATAVKEVEIKKSRFLARAWPIDDASQVPKNPTNLSYNSLLQALALVKEHADPKASHNCYAYKIRYEMKWVDDGEPGGTAGKPILSAIDGEALDRICVLVTRHFGGVKLGAGPLGRAYTAAARECLRTAAVLEVDAEIGLKYHNVFQLHSVLGRFNGKILNKVPTHSGLCVVTFRIEEQYFEDLRSFVAEVTDGIGVPRITDKRKLY